MSTSSSRFIILKRDIGKKEKEKMTGKRKNYTDGAERIGMRAIIKELAKRHSFRIADVDIIIDGLTDILHECMAQNKVVEWKNTLTMRLIDVAGYDGWDNFKKIPIKVPPNRLVYMSPSKKLLESGRLSLLPLEEKEVMEIFYTSIADTSMFSNEVEDWDEIDNEEFEEENDE